ncbi:conserved exported hypothetical protein [metagenome]|uniref:DUF3048 domain-containing protein n=1 Tax=metagenome TaxID=256318 RepID=A0A2P2CBX6_9ZZZZ
MRRARLSVATTVSGLVAASLLLAACGGDKEESTDSPDAQEPVGGTTFASTWPLTGLPVESGDDSALDHPVVVAKVDNSGSEPQAGVGKADLVVEELVEGGITRLAAFFYSDLPTQVGPMRSMRFSDIGIVTPVDAVIATSGAAPITIRKIQDADITFFGEGAKGFSRDSSRSAPYNLMADLGTVVGGIKQEPTRPADYLTWGAADDEVGGQKAKRLQATFSGAHTSEWKYTGDHYTLLNGNSPEGDLFSPDTVLVLRVKTSDAGYKDPAGNPVPETHFTGKGAAMVFHGGKMLRATWSKDALDAHLELTTQNGEVKIPAGHVWIELVPTNGGDVSFK